MAAVEDAADQHRNAEEPPRPAVMSTGERAERPSRAPPRKPARPARLASLASFIVRSGTGEHRL